MNAIDIRHSKVLVFFKQNKLVMANKIIQCQMHVFDRKLIEILTCRLVRVVVSVTRDVLF